MSMISTKNLVAPLTNKVHIIFIILCATAFAALRLSGGSLSLEKPRPRGTHMLDSSRTTQQHQSSSYDNELGNRIQQRNRDNAQRATGFGSIVADLDDPTKIDADTKPARPAVPKSGNHNSASKKGSLDDIEATLGLR